MKHKIEACWRAPTSLSGNARPSGSNSIGILPCIMHKSQCHMFRIRITPAGRAGMHRTRTTLASGTAVQLHVCFHQLHHLTRGCLQTVPHLGVQCQVCLRLQPSHCAGLRNVECVLEAFCIDDMADLVVGRTAAIEVSCCNNMLTRTCSHRGSSASCRLTAMFGNSMLRHTGCKHFCRHACTHTWQT